MKPSKWVMDDEITFARDFGPFTMYAWEDEGIAGWCIQDANNEPTTTRQAKNLAAAKRSADRAARKMVRKMAAELGMVKL